MASVSLSLFECRPDLDSRNSTYTKGYSSPRPTPVTDYSSPSPPKDYFSHPLVKGDSTPCVLKVLNSRTKVAKIGGLAANNRSFETYHKVGGIKGFSILSSDSVLPKVPNTTPRANTAAKIREPEYLHLRPLSTQWYQHTLLDHTDCLEDPSDESGRPLNVIGEKLDTLETFPHRLSSSPLINRRRYLRNESASNVSECDRCGGKFSPDNSPLSPIKVPSDLKLDGTRMWYPDHGSKSEAKDFKPGFLKKTSYICGTCEERMRSQESGNPFHSQLRLRSIPHVDLQSFKTITQQHNTEMIDRHRMELANGDKFNKRDAVSLPHLPYVTSTEKSDSDVNVRAVGRRNIARHSMVIRRNPDRKEQDGLENEEISLSNLLSTENMLHRLDLHNSNSGVATANSSDDKGENIPEQLTSDEKLDGDELDLKEECEIYFNVSTPETMWSNCWSYRKSPSVPRTSPVKSRAMSGKSASSQQNCDLSSVTTPCECNTPDISDDELRSRSKFNSKEISKEDTTFGNGSLSELNHEMETSEYSKEDFIGRSKSSESREMLQDLIQENTQGLQEITEPEIQEDIAPENEFYFEPITDKRYNKWKRERKKKRKQKRRTKRSEDSPGESSSEEENADKPDNGSSDRPDSEQKVLPSHREFIQQLFGSEQAMMCYDASSVSKSSDWESKSLPNLYGSDGSTSVSGEDITDLHSKIDTDENSLFSSSFPLHIDIKITKKPFNELTNSVGPATLNDNCRQNEEKSYSLKENDRKGSARRSPRRNFEAKYNTRQSVETEMFKSQSCNNEHENKPPLVSETNISHEFISGKSQLKQDYIRKFITAEPKVQTVKHLNDSKQDKRLLQSKDTISGQNSKEIASSSFHKSTGNHDSIDTELSNTTVGQFSLTCIRDQVGDQVISNDGNGETTQCQLTSSNSSLESESNNITHEIPKVTIGKKGSHDQTQNQKVCDQSAFEGNSKNSFTRISKPTNGHSLGTVHETQDTSVSYKSALEHNSDKNVPEISKITDDYLTQNRLVMNKNIVKGDSEKNVSGISEITSGFKNTRKQSRTQLVHKESTVRSVSENHVTRISKISNGSKDRTIKKASSTTRAKKYAKKMGSSIYDSHKEMAVLKLAKQNLKKSQSLSNKKYHEGQIKSKLPNIPNTVTKALSKTRKGEQSKQHRNVLGGLLKPLNGQSNPLRVNNLDYRNIPYMRESDWSLIRTLQKQRKEIIKTKNDKTKDESGNMNQLLSRKLNDSPTEKMKRNKIDNEHFSPITVNELLQTMPVIKRSKNTSKSKHKVTSLKIRPENTKKILPVPDIKKLNMLAKSYTDPELEKRKMAKSLERSITNHIPQSQSRIETFSPLSISRAFTFSMFELPIAYKERNRQIKRQLYTAIHTTPKAQTV